MSGHEFIFSTFPRHRLARHAVFWMCWILYSGSIQLTGNFPAKWTFENIIIYQSARAIFRLVPQMLFSYTTVYLLVPRFIPGRQYGYFLIMLFFTVISTFLITYFIFSPLFDLPIIHYGGKPFGSFIMKFYSLYSNINFTGAIPVCCLMLAIKYFKQWYKKQKEGEMLARENAQAELQLLKAQVHPHFLFNTLNNIYSFTLTGHPKAPDLVDQLSGMIDYMRREGIKMTVPLDKEIQLILDYVGLEKVRYGDRLDLQIEIDGVTKGRTIAPLLMIPFVENSFKHGASMMRGSQWIRLQIRITEVCFDFSISNSTSSLPSIQEGKKGIGLANVRKRLQLLYPGKHTLEMDSTDKSFSVHLEIMTHGERKSKVGIQNEEILLIYENV